MACTTCAATVVALSLSLSFVLHPALLNGNDTPPTPGRGALSLRRVLRRGVIDPSA